MFISGVKMSLPDSLAQQEWQKMSQSELKGIGLWRCPVGHICRLSRCGQHRWRCEKLFPTYWQQLDEEIKRLANSIFPETLQQQQQPSQPIWPLKTGTDSLIQPPPDDFINESAFYCCEHCPFTRVMK